MFKVNPNKTETDRKPAGNQQTCMQVCFPGCSSNANGSRENIIDDDEITPPPEVEVSETDSSRSRHMEAKRFFWISHWCGRQRVLSFTDDLCIAKKLRKVRICQFFKSSEFTLARDILILI